VPKVRSPPQADTQIRLWRNQFQNPGSHLGQLVPCGFFIFFKKNLTKN